jgi:hypothetical protein
MQLASEHYGGSLYKHFRSLGCSQDVEDAVTGVFGSWIRILEEQ